MTPEGKVKKAVKKLLDCYKPRLWYDMPVPTGRGKSTLDFMGIVNGEPFAVETKAEGEKPTDRQLVTANELAEAGCAVFLVTAGGSFANDLNQLSTWLLDCDEPIAGTRDHAHNLHGAGLARLVNDRIIRARPIDASP